MSFLPTRLASPSLYLTPTQSPSNRIQIQLAIIIPESLSQHNLFVDGRLIKHERKSIAHYGIFGRILIYRPYLIAAPYYIFVKTLTGRTISIVGKRSSTINDVKQLVQDNGGAPWNANDSPYAKSDSKISARLATTTS